MHHKLFGYTVSCNVETIKCEWKIKSVSEYKYWYEDRSWKQMSCFNRAGAHIARKQSALECVYLRERTSLIVVCWKLHVSLIVCRLFRTPLQVSKCLLRPSSLLQHYIILQLGNKICLSWSYFPFSVGAPFLILLISAFFTLSSSLLWGFYRPDRQIMGVVSTLQLRAVIHTNFFHNQIHWQSPLILLITTILSSKPSSSERTYCTST